MVVLSRSALPRTVVGEEVAAQVVDLEVDFAEGLEVVEEAGGEVRRCCHVSRVFDAEDFISRLHGRKLGVVSSFCMKLCHTHLLCPMCMTGVPPDGSCALLSNGSCWKSGS